MYKDIKFSPPRQETLGRNGYSKSCGISVCEMTIMDEHIVTLEPINSRGDIGRARLVVPMAHVRELRDALTDMLNEAAHDQGH